MQAILTDLEGTTTALAFVQQTLFPYARQRLAGFLAAHPDLEVVRAAEAAARLEQPGQPPAETLAAWIDADRKIGALKALQGCIWRDGYRSGELVGHFWPDAVRGLRRLAARPLRLAVYSSGSVEAQQLLFRHSVAGDLSPLIEAWFDTGVGPKREAASYREICRRLELPGEQMLFLSDVPAELDAARSAGLRTCCLERGEAGDPPPHDHPVARSFDEVLAN